MVPLRVSPGDTLTVLLVGEISENVPVPDDTRTIPGGLFVTAESPLPVHSSCE